MRLRSEFSSQRRSMNTTPETYTSYLKRVSGLPNFTPLSQEVWEDEVNKSGVLVAVKTADKTVAALVVNSVMGQFIPAGQDPVGMTKNEGSDGYKELLNQSKLVVASHFDPIELPVEDVPEDIVPVMLDHLPEGSH